MTVVEYKQETGKAVNAEVRRLQVFVKVNRQRSNVISSEGRNIDQTMSPRNFFEVGREIMPTATFCRHGVAEILLHTYSGYLSSAWGATASNPRSLPLLLGHDKHFTRLI